MADQPEPIKTQDAGADGTPKELSEKELKKKQKQAEKAAKAAKAKEKQAKLEQQKAAKKETTEGAEAQKDKEKDKKKLRLRSEFVNTTPKGEKKDMTGDMLEAYDPPQVEAAWYEWWEKQGYFKADNQTTKEKFVIVIPPPNVTGSLHLGHALTNSVQDAIVRWHRMHGREVLWVPGLDHAGIATQNVVEKKIAKERNQTRHDLGRENFVQEVWKWKQEYGDRILFQLRRLGSSLDWSREAFTMNEMLSKAVTEAFVRLFDDKKIYRATRLVNWCTQLNTAIADIEVDHEELEGQTMRKVPGHGDKEYPFGQLVFFSYPIEGSDDKITVATTRVETMLADTAIAVNPTDERYKKFHGKFAIHPFNGRKIPIVLDAELVKDITLGSGAVKVTPAHDPDDYDCGVRNKLPMIDLFTDDGHINENGAPFAGMKRFDARVAVTEALKQKGLLVEVKSHKMKIPLCSRSKDVIEPRLKPQWWVDCKSMAQASIKAVETGELKIFPEAHVDTWYRWLGNIRDWCISRQLWWGHRVPAYHINIKGKPRLDESNAANWAVGRTEDEARSRAAKQFGVPEDQIELKQDEDVLDTWFSSGLFPFSVFGWPDNTTDLQAFYPTSLLETGHDILFFWVARMVMMGLHLTGKLPFKEVLLHAMVRDAHGRKMTKSLGNVIDPIDVIEGITLEDLHKKLEQSNLKDEEIEKAKKGQKEDFPNGISECGTDATRFALCAYTCQGRDINLDINRVVSYRNFCNKLWNATRFALSEKVLGKDFKPTPSQKLSGKENLIDKWILSRLNSAIRTSNEGFKEYDFGKITTSVYNFWLYELCDVYLEAIKPVVYGAEGTPEDKKAALDTLYTCLDNGLRLLHPFMPFVTEELWQRLNRRAGDTTPSICISSYPTIDGEWDNPTVENEIKSVQEVIKAARAIRLDYKLLAKTKTSMVVNAHNEALKTLYEKYRIPTLSLTTSEDIKYVVNEKPQPGCAVSIVNENCEVYLLIANVVNLDAELTKLGKQQQKLEGDIATWEKKMAAKDYEKIKAEVKQQNANKLASLKQELETTLKAIESFSSLKK